MVTAKEVTNWYLYGTNSTPTNLVDDSLIRPASATKTIEIDTKDFMETAGRFAIGSQFELVQKFFEEFSKPAGTYSKAEVGQELGLKSYGWSMQHYDWRDETDDYAERTYIYNTQEFKISDDAVFIVAPDGTKRIEKFAIEPREIEEEPDQDEDDFIARDNFDFEGGGFLTNLGNSILVPKVDPSEIGRTVYFDYINQNTIPTVTYDRASYESDIEKRNSFTQGSNFFVLNNEINQLTDDLFDEGVTKFLDEKNRPIFYGTEEADNLSELNVGIGEAPKLGPFLNNGIVLIGGSGEDVIEGTSGNSELHGGDGNDELFAAKSDNTFIGGKGDDIMIGGVSTSAPNDISIYAGPKADYSIEFMTNGSVKIADTVGDRDGTDTLTRVGFAKFSDQQVPIGPGQDISFVIDRTGSMSDDIQAVKEGASKIVDAIFDSDSVSLNSRISVVGYNDSGPTTYLSFTDQPKIEDRKTASINAINSISISGGYEPVNGALIHSLSGQAGEWRPEATARRIFLFGDEPANDPELLSEVLELASDVGVSSSGSLSASSIASNIETSSVNENLAVTRFALQTTESDGTSTTTPVEIFTILIGNDSAASSDFQNLATATGGEFFNAANASEVVDAILAAIETPIDEEEINRIEGTSGRDNLTGTDGNDTIAGFQSRDILTGGGGNDIFRYTALVDAGDIITDFEVGSDKFDLVGVLNSVGFAGVDPIAEGYVGFSSRSQDTILTIDADGAAGSGSPQSFLLAQGVTAQALNNPDNFIFA